MRTITTLSLFAGLVALTSMPVSAQNTNPSISGASDALQKPTNQPGLPDRVDILERQMAELAGNMTRLTEAVRENLTTIQQNHGVVIALTEEIQSQLANQGRLLDAIASKDPDGNAFVRLDSIMSNSSTGREQVRQAVEQSLRGTGTFTVENRMGYEQYISVNGIQYRVLAGSAFNLTVPVGTVTTQLPGQEIVNWTIAPPLYAQTIQIRPKYTTYRPIPAPIDVTPPPQYVSPLPAYPIPIYPTLPLYAPWFLDGYSYVIYP